MSQVIAPPVGGLTLGAGPSGPVRILFGYGSPNTQASADVQLASQGSLYLQLDGADATHTFWVCTSGGVPKLPNQLPQVNSVWTAK